MDPTSSDVHVPAPMGGSGRKAKNKLRAPVIKEVSLVDRGCNPESKSVLHKRKPDTINSSEQHIEKGDASMPMTAEELQKKLEEQEAAVAKANQERDEAVAKSTELETKVADLEKKFPPKKEEGEEEAAQKMLKELPEELRKQYETEVNKAKADAAEAVQIAKAEREKREEMEFAKRAETELPNLSGSDVEKGKFLKFLSTAPADVKEIGEKLLKAANESAAEVFVEKGAAAGATPTAKAEVEEKLKKMAESHSQTTGLSFHKAYTAIMETPEGSKLYNQLQAQK